MTKNRKLCLFIIGFLFFFLSFAILFITPSPALAATSYQWNTTTTIKDSTGVMWFSYAHERVQALDNEQWGSTNYTFICEQVLEVLEQEPTTNNSSCTLGIKPTNPLKGTITIANASGGSTTDIVLTDPNAVAPAPLEIIEKGWLIGQIIPDSNISLTNQDQLTNGKVWLKRDGVVVGIDGIGGLGSPNYREIYKSGNSFYYVGIDISKIPINKNDGIYGLYAGEYQMSFSYSQGADCMSREMETTAIDIQLTCRATLEGSINFFLERTSDGGAKITIYDNNDLAETSSLTNGNVLSTSPDATNGTNIYAAMLMDSPLDKALSSAIKTLAGFVGSFMKTAVGGINDLLDGTADLVLGDGVTTGVESAWTKIRNIALTLLIMALIIIAFANVLQIDIEQYGLNRMIPRIIISIIMAYLSWIIVTFFFDFSLALQKQAEGLLSGDSGLDALGSIIINTPTGGDILAKAGAVLVLLVILIGILICLVILWFSLLMRVVVLSFLLAVAPLAFILNIMPFTSKLYKQWWSEFFKWMFMGPIAVTIIALGSVIASSSFQFSGSMNLSGDSTTPGGSGWNMLIGLLILGASIYFAATLPQKWGGKIMGGWQKAGKGLGKWAGNTTGISGAKNLIGNRIKTWSGNQTALRANKLASFVTKGKVGTSADVLKRQQFDAAVTEAGKQVGVAASNDGVLAKRYTKANTYEKAAIEREMAGRGSFEKLFAAEHIDSRTGTFYDENDAHWGTGGKAAKEAAERKAKVLAGERLVELDGGDTIVEKAVKDNQGEIMVAASDSTSKYRDTAKAKALKGGFLSGQSGKSGHQKRTQAMEFLEGVDAEKFLTARDVQQIMGKDGDTKKQGHLKDFVFRGAASREVSEAYLDQTQELRPEVAHAPEDNRVQDSTVAQIMAESEQDHRNNMDEIRRRGGGGV